VLIQGTVNGNAFLHRRLTPHDAMERRRVGPAETAKIIIAPGKNMIARATNWTGALNPINPC
jgi:hypothetical protein